VINPMLNAQNNNQYYGTYKTYIQLLIDN